MNKLLKFIHQSSVCSAIRICVSCFKLARELMKVHKVQWLDQICCSGGWRLDVHLIPMILFLFAQGYIIFLNDRLCNKQCKQQHYEDWRIFSQIKIKRFGQNWLCISCGYVHMDHGYWPKQLSGRAPSQSCRSPGLDSWSNHIFSMY